MKYWQGQIHTSGLATTKIRNIAIINTLFVNSGSNMPLGSRHVLLYHLVASMGGRGEFLRALCGCLPCRRGQTRSIRPSSFQ